MSNQTVSNELPEGVTRETMDADILVVGGGVAGLSAALHLANLLKQQGAPEQMIVVLEKAAEVGAHSLSGAVLNPKALAELIPTFKEDGCPLDAEVTYDAVHYLSGASDFKLPITPAPFHNKGNFIISIAKFNRWLAGKCEEKGINIFPGFAAVEAIYEGNKIVGVRTGDKGRDKHGKPKANFEPGMIIKAKLVIFAEGTRGSLFRQVTDKLNLRAGKNHEIFEEGVKEIIQMPAGTVTPGRVIHTLGFPLKKSIGGTFIYTIPGDKIIVGLVAYLDSKDPLLDPHRELQKLKTHPFMKKMLEGGKVLAYGGKTLPAGGWYSMPKLFGDGWMVVGDSASMVDVQKLKGIHLAMKAGMLVAETAVQAVLAGDYSEKTLQAYGEKVQNSYVKKELYRVRNFHQTLSKGMFISLPLIALQEITGGRGLFNNVKVDKTDAETTKTLAEVWGEKPWERPENKLPTPDGKLFYDKLSSVYLTGTMHDEDSPNHLLLKNGDTCRTHCHPKYGSPCNQFCPASVYEMVPSVNHPGQYDLQINYTNCIHCKTCDIKCPTDNILWTPPEGGGGPKYTEV
jgi:electron-transferring-flavoprotein dehydrogenase